MKNKLISKQVAILAGLLALSPIVLADANTESIANDNAIIDTDNDNNADIFSTSTLPVEKKKESGFYVRGQAGLDWKSGGKKKKTAKAGEKEAPVEPYTLSKSSGITGRIAAGYNINRNFAVEVGASIPHSFISAPNGIPHNDQEQLQEAVDTKKQDLADAKESDKPAAQKAYDAALATAAFIKLADLKTSLWAIDAMAKIKYPFGRLYAFGGAGIAYVHSKTTVTGKKLNGANDTDTDGTSTPPAITYGVTSVSKSFIQPKIAVGLGYDISDNLSADVEYSRIFGRGDPKNIWVENKAGKLNVHNDGYLPSINAVMVGLSYKF